MRTPKVHLSVAAKSPMTRSASAEDAYSLANRSQKLQSQVQQCHSSAELAE
jgi:hypothetical protein